jgi:hypothetical protein
MKRVPLESPTPEIRIDNSRFPAWFGLLLLAGIVVFIAWLTNHTTSDPTPNVDPSEQTERGQK